MEYYGREAVSQLYTVGGHMSTHRERGDADDDDHDHDHKHDHEHEYGHDDDHDHDKSLPTMHKDPSLIIYP